MAVKVYWHAASNGALKDSEFEQGQSYTVSDTGFLFLWNNRRSTSPEGQVAVYAPGQWVSAVVAQEKN